jgi:hypothetical protein
LTDQVQQHLTALPKPQQKALAFFVSTLLQTQSVQQTKIARCPLPLTEAKPDSRERRFQRFLATTKQTLEAVQQQWAGWVLSCLPPPQDKEPLVLLVDETSLQEHVRVMAVCLAWQGRAIPLAWKAYPAHKDRCQVEIIVSLLSQIRRGVPSEQAVVVQADRGIGVSPALLCGIAALGWFYLVRVTNQVRVRFAGDGSEVAIGSLLKQAGETIALTFGEAFKKFGWLACGILGCYEVEHKEGWCLVTNYPGATCRGYALRMWVEACFKDLKSGSWNWHLSCLREASRVERLWLVMALSTLFGSLLGSLVSRESCLRRLVSRGRVRRCSYLQWGVRLFVALLSGRVWVKEVVWQAGTLMPCLPDNPFAPSPPKTVVQ